MFLPAGITWWKGWLFLAIFLLQMAITAVYIWRKNPDLFVARSRMQKGTKGWDRTYQLLSKPRESPSSQTVPPWLKSASCRGANASPVTP